nr:hypothetical protein CFP56_36407 [Quercus suber]
MSAVGLFTTSLEDDVSQPDSNDTASLRTEAGAYGQVYGTSAVSAFGGPATQPHTELSGVTRSFPITSFTSHAAPSADFSHFLDSPHRLGPRRRAISNPAPEPSPLATRESFLILHAKVYAAAECLGVRGLKALALDKFKLQLTRHWYVGALVTSQPFASLMIGRDSPEFAKAIVVVYNSTPVTDLDMREAVINALGWHSKLLDKPEIELAVMDINGLAYELLKRSRRAEPEYLR